MLHVDMRKPDICAECGIRFVWNGPVGVFEFDQFAPESLVCQKCRTPRNGVERIAYRYGLRSMGEVKKLALELNEVLAGE